MRGSTVRGAPRASAAPAPASPEVGSTSPRSIRRVVLCRIRSPRAVDVAFTDLQIDGVDRSDLAVAFRQSTSSDDMPVGDGLVDHVRAMRSVAARVSTSGVTVPASRNRMPSRRYGVTSKPTGPTRDTVSSLPEQSHSPRSRRRSGPATSRRSGSAISVAGPAVDTDCRGVLAGTQLRPPNETGRSAGAGVGGGSDVR